MSPRRSQAPPLRAQAPAHFVLADAKHAVPVVGVGVIAQKEQKIPHLDGGLPQSLLLLPALPAVQAADAEDHHQCQRYQGFHQGVAMFSVHGVEYAAAIGPGATTENSFPGQIRKKLCILDRRTFFANVYPTLPTATTCGLGAGENNLLPVVTESAPIGWCEGHKTGAIGRRLVISAGVKSPPAL